MIFSVDVKFEAVDAEAANAVRQEIAHLLAAGLDRPFDASGPYEVAPLVQFEEEAGR